MSNRVVRLAFLLAILGVVLTVASAVQAQIEPSPFVLPAICRDITRYDLNRDGRVNGADFSLWVQTVHEGRTECKLGGPASACPGFVDVDYDGLVTTGDLDAMQHYLTQCVYVASRVP